MENLKAKISENKKFIVILIITTFFTSFIMILIYNLNFNNNSFPISSNKLDTISQIVNDVNKVNSNLENCLNDFTLNNKTIVDTLKSNINSLEEAKDTLKSTVLLDDKSREIYPKLIFSIESTQNLYNYCIYALDSKNFSSISNSISKINELEFELLQSYQELQKLNIPIQFNNDAILFLDKFNSYLSELDNLNKQNKIKTTQANDFLKIYKSVLTDLSNLIEDVTPAILKIREDNRSLDIIIENISEKEAALLDIQNTIKKTSIPDGYLSHYKNLNDHIKTHSTYLNTLKLAVIYEKSFPDYLKNKKNIDKNYINSSSKLEDVQESIESLNKSLKSY